MANKIYLCFETRSLPALARCFPRSFTLITRTARVLAPATLAALPSTRAIPDRDVFYVASPNRSILRSPHTALGIHQRAEIRSDQKKEKFKNGGHRGGRHN